MRCLYAGCSTTEESGDTFHKVVGSCGRDGKPLYICTVHFEKLKSSKSPSLVSCNQPVVRSAASRKGNSPNEGIETIDSEPEEINQRENEGKKTITTVEREAVVEKEEPIQEVAVKKGHLQVRIAKKPIDKVRTVLGEASGYLPPIIRKKKGSSGDELKDGKSCHSVAPPFSKLPLNVHEGLQYFRAMLDENEHYKFEADEDLSSDPLSLDEHERHSLERNQPNQLGEYEVLKQSNVKLYRKMKTKSNEVDYVKTPEGIKRSPENNSANERSFDRYALKKHHSAFDEHKLKRCGPDEFSEYKVDRQRNVYVKRGMLVHNDEGGYQEESEETLEVEPFGHEECLDPLSLDDHQPRLNLDEYEAFLISKTPENVDLKAKWTEKNMRTVQCRRCSAVGCMVTHPNEKLFRFPSDPQRNKIWCQVAFGKDTDTDYRAGFLCARHFRVNDFYQPDRQKLVTRSTPSYPTGPLNPYTQDYCPIEDVENLKDLLVYCSAVNCGLSLKTHPDVTFTPFPPKGDSRRYEQWWKVAGEVRNPKYLCSRHFDITQFSDDRRTCIKSCAIPKYKSGPLNPVTKDYAPQPDVSEISSDDPTAAFGAVIGRNIRIASIQNVKIGAISRAVGQTVRIPGASPTAGSNLKVAKLNSYVGRNAVIPGARGIPSQQIAVTNSPGIIIKIPTAADSGDNQNTVEDNLGDDEMNAISKRCDAVDCPASYKHDPRVKYFSFPAMANHSSASEKKRRQLWIDVVGGTKSGRARFLCQYHFAADTFVDEWRTTLVRRANPSFPFGPLNPTTNDYCPKGEEQRSLSSRDFLRARCCVDECTTFSFNTNGLFGFPVHDREAYEEWTKRVGVNKYFTEQHIRMKFRICPKHFSKHCTVIDQEKQVHLKFGALPTINVPCFNGPPDEINSFVQNRSLSSDEVEALQMLSDSGRICNMKDVFDQVEDEVTTLQLKRKIGEEQATPTKKCKDDPAPGVPGKQLVLLPVQDLNGQQTYVLADVGSNEQNHSPQPADTAQNSADASVVPNKDKLASTIPRLCTYWSPDEINDKVAMKKKREEATKRRLERLREVRASRSITHSLKNRNTGKVKTAKEIYEDFSLGIQEENIGNEVDIDMEKPLERTVDNEKVPVLPTEKTDNTETALLKIFGACDASDDNVFSCFIDSSKVPEHEEEANVHSYCSSNSLNVIRSAAELCEFNDLKMKQLERLIGVGEETSSELEQILIKHLGSVMCITGVEFLKKCFDQVLKEEIVKKKEKDKARKSAPNKPEPHVPLNVRYPCQTKKFAIALQTFSGKAYHAMTQLMDLPSQSITRSWTCRENGDPGFSVRAFKLLDEEVSKRKVVTVSLGLAEVPLKQDVSWDGERTFGLTDLGYGTIDNDYIPEASRAIVFFAIALNQSWKIPLGYCLADNLTPAVRANLVIQYLYKLAYSGVKCISLVCNYSLATYQMLVELGAISEEYYAPFTGSFPHPSFKGDRVHCFIDIHQLIKSINTLWAEQQVFAFKNKETIEYSHMDRLNEFIQSDKFPDPGLANVYNDLLSLKTLIEKDPRSSYKYNALVLALLENLGLDGFENVTETAVFLNKLNSITELFSSCHPQDERQPLDRGNYQVVTQKLNSVIAYFNNLTYKDGTKVMTSTRKLPLVLLFSNITSLKTMIKKVFAVDKYKLINIKTGSLSMDCVHEILLEMTGGKDSLLTPLQFKKAFVKFVETVSMEPSSRIQVCAKAKEPTPLPIEHCLGFGNSFSYQFAPVSTVCESIHEFFTENVIENWLQATHCTDCSQLIQKELLKYGNHDSKGNVIEDIHRMLRMAETLLAELDEIPMDAFTSWFDKLANKTLNSLTSLKGFKNYSHLFNSKPFGEVTHFTVMIKDMLRIFLRLRLCFLSRQEKIRIRLPRQYSLRFCLGRSWA